MKQHKISITLSRILYLLLPLLAFSACNSDDDTKDTDNFYAPPTDVAVNAFSLRSNINLLRGLDSVYFSIDLERALIFNADSLPKGTNITKLVPNITYSSHITSAVIEMTGGSVRTGTVDYRRNPGDSIDFSGKVTLTLTSSSGNSRSYDLKVNVHKLEPDSLCWGQTAMSRLPSRMASPRQQRTVQMDDKIFCLIQEKDGTLTAAMTTHPEQSAWEKHVITLPFTPRLRTLTATSAMLYMLADDGSLYTSSDALTWTASNEKWDNIIGAYGSRLLGLKSTAAGRVITTLGNSGADVALKGQLAEFPVEDYSNLYCYQSKWMQSPIAVLIGGVTAGGEVSDRVWGYDGNSWVVLSKGQLPALRCPTLIPYFSFLRSSGIWVFNEYSTLMLTGGMLADGKMNKELYISYNNGVAFKKGTEMMQLPEFIPAMWESDAVISSIDRSQPLSVAWTQMPEEQLHPWYRINTSLDGTTVKWECPYIYLFGGTDADGLLYNTIWRGVINRLTFVPVI